MMRSVYEREELLELLGPALTQYEESAPPEVNTYFDPACVWVECEEHSVAYLDYKDPDGDIVTVYMQLSDKCSPGAADWTAPNDMAADCIGVTGTEGTGIVLRDPVWLTGECKVIKVWAVDSKGNESEQVTAVLEECVD